MATDVFQLLGSISVDTTAFHANMTNALATATELYNMLNSINGLSVNPGVGGQSTTTGSGNTGANTNTGTSTQSPASPASSVTAAGVGAATAQNGSGWTVSKGVIANYATQIGNWLWQEVKEFVKTGWDRNVSEEKFSAQMISLTGGNTATAKKLMYELNKFALDTPLAANETWNAAKKILNYGISEDELIKTMQMLGDITQGDSTAMLSTAKAYSEAAGKGKLYTQEAYQFINAGVPIFQLLEKLYASDKHTGGNKGLSAQEIKGRLNLITEAGIEVPFEDIQAALEMATSPGGQYHDSMNNMMNTIYGQQDRIGENTEVLAARVTKPLTELANKYIFPKVLDFQNFLIDQTDPGYMELYGDTVKEVTKSKQVPAVSDAQTRESLRNAYAGLFGSFVQPSSSEIENTKKMISPINSVWESLFSWFNNTKEILTITAPETKTTYTRQRNDGGGAPAGDPALYTQFNETNILDRFGGGISGRIPFDKNQNGGAMNLMLAAFQNLPAQLETKVATAAREGVANGLNGVTITGHITTGDVKLQDGTLVGSLMPQINMQLGWETELSGRA